MIKKTALLLFLSLLFFCVTPTLAAVTPEPLPTGCGFAGVTNSDSCCNANIGNIDTGEINKNFPQIGSSMPNLPAGEYLTKMGVDKLIKQCYIGDPYGGAGSCICKATVSATLVNSVGILCDKFDKSEASACKACANSNGYWSGLGCIPLNMTSFISIYILRTGIGLGGVFSLLCIIYSAFMMQTSQGSPEKIKKAQENLTSCVIGLILIIFSVFILRLIGVTILKIPGLN